jgi:hypothetical protein
MWCKWLSIEDFNAWHEAIKATLGYPFSSVDSSGNKCEPMNTNYTMAVIVANDDIRAWVDEKYAHGLVSSEAPPQPQREVYETKTE